jgi:hypothetical protein
MEGSTRRAYRAYWSRIWNRAQNGTPQRRMTFEYKVNLAITFVLEDTQSPA